MEEIDEFTIIVKDSNTQLFIIGRTIWEKYV